jgi:hypothetical protein
LSFEKNEDARVAEYDYYGRRFHPRGARVETAC